MESVTILDVNIPSSSQFTVSWEDNNPSCSQRYRVTYKVNNVEISSKTEVAGATSSTLDLHYCAEGTVEVVAFTSDTSESDPVSMSVDLRCM